VPNRGDEVTDECVSVLLQRRVIFAGGPFVHAAPVSPSRFLLAATFHPLSREQRREEQHLQPDVLCVNNRLLSSRRYRNLQLLHSLLLDIICFAQPLYILLHFFRFLRTRITLYKLFNAEPFKYTFDFLLTPALSVSACARREVYPAVGRVKVTQTCPYYPAVDFGVVHKYHWFPPASL
jgi:hypothetical protein